MLVQCTHCGESIAMNGLGRKPLAMSFLKVYNALQL